MRVLSRFVSLLLAAFFCGTASAQTPDAVRLQRAYERIDAFIAQHMREARTPGLALAVTNREGLLRVATFGFADLKARVTVTPDTLFEIGSISKSFTSVALLQLREEGKFDPHAPLTMYWPWFGAQSKFPPFTGHHLLSHTAGIPRDRDDIPSSPYSAWALRARVTGTPPGEHFAYSNVGYQTLGYLLERLDGKSYAEIIRQRILDRLGMTKTEPVITFAARARMAVGYQLAYDDRPSHSSHPIVEAPWFEYGAGDGSVASTPAELAAYARMILNRGAAPQGRVLSEESFKLLTQPVGKAGENLHYGYGLFVENRGGRNLVWHTGGMVGYAAMLLTDTDAGIGVVVFVNGPGNPSRVGNFALDCVRAALRGEELPALPDPANPSAVKNAADYAGTFAASDGRQLNFAAEGERLLLVHGGERIALERRGTDRFYAPHPDFALFLLAFGRASGEKAAEKDKPGPVVEVSFGEDWYANERYSGPRAFSTPAEWNAYPGHYRTTNPWFSNFRVVLRKGKLWMITSGGGEEELVPLEPGLFRVDADEKSAERIRFDTVLEGKALRANVSGVDFYRVFTP